MAGLGAISAGGDKSAAAMGIMVGISKYDTNGLDRNIWCGISAGALIGSQMAQIETGKNAMCIHVLERLMNMDVDFVEPWSRRSNILGIIYGALWHESLFKPNLMHVIKPLWKEKKYRTLVVGTTNITKGEYESFEQPSIEMVVASASVPVVFPSVQYNGNRYCDGAMHHVIPIREIKQYWKEGPLDVILCYPMDHAEYIKSNIPESKHMMYSYVFETLSEALWNNMVNDMRELARYYNLDYEKVKKGGRFMYEGREIRIYVPTKGVYLDFTKRNRHALHIMHAHGEQIAKSVLTDPNYNHCDGAPNGVPALVTSRVLRHETNRGQNV